MSFRFSFRIRSALRALLILSVAVGVRGARADDKRFAVWEPAIAAFEREDQVHPPPTNAVLFVGSSSIRFWDVHKSFPGLDVINRGFGGSQIADSVHFAPRIVIKYRPRIIVFYAGDNDIGFGKTPEQVAADFQEFVKVVHAKLPQTRILFLSIKASAFRWKLIERMRRANALIEANCKQEKGLRYIDVSTCLLGDDGKPRKDLFRPDGLHLNAKGYELWAGIVTPYLGSEK